MPDFVHIFRPLARTLTLLAALLLATQLTHAQEKENANVITEGKQVSFHYTLTSDGEEVESSKGKEPLTYTQGGGQILEKLESELEGLQAGDTKVVELEAAEAYGEVDPEGIKEVPAEQIPEQAREVGAMLRAQGFEGPIFVKEVREEVVVLDFNHPMAGKDLKFDVEIVEVQ